MAVRVYIIKYLRPLDLLVLLREQYCRLWILYDILCVRPLHHRRQYNKLYLQSPPLTSPLAWEGLRGGVIASNGQEFYRDEKEEGKKLKMEKASDTLAIFFLSWK